ncbi:MAG: fibronectin type III domain-containing protein, partial [Thermoguttaceae bacterium]|nr:fibronectin type III domain-containing protein [Thermoguttaceae bacterium]
PTGFQTNGNEATYDASKLIKNETELVWDNVYGETGYKLRYTTDVDKTDAEAVWVEAGTVAADVLSQELGLAYGTSYKYQICAVNQYGQSDWVTVEFATVAAPVAPTELTVSKLDPETHTVKLTWQDVDDELEYQVKLYNANGDVIAATVCAANETTWTPPALALGTSYKFQVTAKNNAGAATAELTFATENVPTAPTGLKATIVDAAETSATLTWNAAPETGAEVVTAYVVTYTDGQTTFTETVDVATAENPTTLQLPNLIKAATYSVTVVAQNAYGDSAAATVKFSTLEAPSTVVTTLSDVVDKYDGEISLREAISYAEADATLGTTITFDAEAYADELDADGKATIVLGGSQLVVSQALTIDGGENGVTIDANQKSRVFGVTSTSAPAAFKNLTLTGGKNTSTYGAGGVIITTGAKATFENVTISGNSTTTNFSGGAYLAPQASAVFTNVTISQNTGKNGGGVYVDTDAQATFTNVVISGNTAKTSGGGVYFYSGTARFKNVEISGNTATTNGGGVYVYTGTSWFTNVKVSGNTSKSSGGGVYLYSGATTTFTNVEISGNTATTNGGGVYVYNNVKTWTSFNNATITGNVAPPETGGAGVYGGGRTNIYNSILVDNAGGDFVDAGISNAYNTLSSFTAWDNASTDAATQYVYDETQPLFTDAENGDYTLAAGSQAINKGADSYVADSITTDLAGNPRFNGTVDLGAFEEQTPFAPINLTATVLNPETLTVDLTWIDDGGNKTGYVVETLVDGVWVAATEETLAADATKWTTGQLELGTTYAYRVAAVNAYGQSDWATVEFTTEDLPAAPANLQATVNVLEGEEGAPTTIRRDYTTLVWDAVENVDGYLVQRSVDGGAWEDVAELAADVTSFETGKLAYASAYVYRVGAVNEYGVVWSEVAFSTLAQETDDQYEANDELAQATRLGMVGSLTLDLKAGPTSNQDYFKFTMVADGGADNYVKIAYDYADDARLALEIYDYNGGKLASLDPSTTGVQKISLAHLLAGDYYVVVYNVETSEYLVDYKLSIEAPQVAPEKPSNFRTNGGENDWAGALLMWADVRFETGYEIERSVAGGEWEAVAAVS